MPPRFSWDYLPLEGNSIADQRGMRAPQVRIRLAAFPRDKNTDPASVKYAIEEKYRDVAQQALRAFRQNVALGSIPLSYQKRQLPDGTFIEYANSNGQEFIVITVSASAMTKMEKEGISMPCMLVLYDGSHVAAIPMDAINKAAPIYKKRLARSSWGTDRAKTLQMPSGNGGIICSTLYPERTRVNSGGLHVVATSKGGAFKNSLSASGSEPIAASDGTTMYVGGGSYTQFNGRVSGSSGSSQDTPCAVDASGKKYYGHEIVSDYLYIAHLNVKNPSAPMDSAGQADLDAKIKQVEDTEPGDPYRGQYITGYTAYSDDGSIEWKYGYGYGGGGGSGTGWPMKDPDISLAIPYQFGNASTCGMQKTQVSGKAEVIPWTTRDYISVTVLGRTFSAGDVGSGYPATSKGSFISFPPSLNDGQAYISIDEPDATIYTPYETLSGTGSDFKGWLHVGDGQNLLQGYAVSGNPALFLNGSPYYSLLLAKLNASTIQSVMLNVPLSAIKALA